MSVFHYYFGLLYIVYHENKGFWNNDKKSNDCVYFDTLTKEEW